MVKVNYERREEVLEYVKGLIEISERHRDLDLVEDIISLDELRRNLLEVRQGTELGKKIYERWESFYDKYSGQDVYEVSLEELIEGLKEFNELFIEKDGGLE